MYMVCFIRLHWFVHLITINYMVCLIRLHLVYASEICYVRKTQEDVIAYMMNKTELYISKI